MVTVATSSPGRQPAGDGAGRHRRERRSLPHVPALDGVRGIAVVMVLLFHAGFGWFTGGFLGVSVFFVLSGYLITNLLAVEATNTGGISLVAFWGRRFRRLAPAALTVLTVLLVVGAFWGITSRSVSEIRASALHVANWWFLHEGRSYADITATPSPVDHFWSLAIEEQFYLLYPFLIWACIRFGRPDRSDRRVGTALTVLAVTSLALQFSFDDLDRIYRGTDTRAFELLAGAGLALALPLTTRRRRANHAATLTGVLGGVALVVASTVATVSDRWLYRGGLPVLALCSCAVIWASVHPGRFANVLSWGPLVWLGTISYGVYLIHWPVFIWLDARRTGLGLWPLFGLRMTVTLALAVLSYQVIEQPIRRGRLLTGRPGAVGYVGALATVLIISLLVPTVVDDREAIADLLSDPARAGVGLVGQAPKESTAPTSSLPGATTTTTAPLPPVVALAGDSVPTVLAAEVADLQPELGVRILNLGIRACDGARGAPHLRYGPGREIDESPECTDWETRWPELFAATDPVAVVFMLGGAAVLDRKIGGRWTNACRPDFQAWYTAELLHRIDVVATMTDAKLILATSPPAEYGTLGLPAGHRQRTDCLNRMYEQVLKERPSVARLDLEGWLCPRGPNSCAKLRSDGVHYRGDGAVTLARWLFPEVLRIVAAEPVGTGPTTTLRPGSAPGGSSVRPR